MHAWDKKKDIVRSMLKNISYSNILDIGCKTGKQLESHITKDMLGVGIDIDLKNTTGKANYICATGLNMPFKSECFDVITSTEVIEHVSDHNKFLSEIHRVLATGGFFILSTPNESQISSVLRRCLEFIFHKEYLDAPDHVSKVTPKILKNELKEAGFKIVTIKYGSFNPYIFPPYFLIFKELKLFNLLYFLIDKITDYLFFKKYTKWDIIVKSKKRDEK
jgi:2-polyprenyl-6-hydroxyphenyl methylase/3-demethylubiquinone-9 3-methyltransferase